MHLPDQYLKNNPHFLRKSLNTHLHPPQILHVSSAKLQSIINLHSCSHYQ